jgi:hypothetical protein
MTASGLGTMLGAKLVERALQQFGGGDGAHTAAQ